MEWTQFVIDRQTDRLELKQYIYIRVLYKWER